MCIRDRENTAQPGHLPEPYPAKYRKEDKKLRTVLVPNISAPVSTLLTAPVSYTHLDVYKRQGQTHAGKGIPLILFQLLQNFFHNVHSSWLLVFRDALSSSV